MAKIAVFCSSSAEVAPMFMSEAQDLGRELARAGHQIIYGGANCGMMGAFGRGVLESNGELIGVIPALEFCDGLTLNGLTRQVTVANLAERKLWMLNEDDIAVALPGGIGTLDEIFECLVLKSTNIWSKPFFFYNFLDFWDPLTEALTLMSEQRMITQPLDDLFQVIRDRNELLQCARRGNFATTKAR